MYFVRSRSTPRSGAQPEDKKEVKTPALKAFGRDLTELARKGEMDPVVGRKLGIRPVDRCENILFRQESPGPGGVSEGYWEAEGNGARRQRGCVQPVLGEQVGEC